MKRRSIFARFASAIRLQQRTLLYTISAPDAAINKDLHLPLKASDELLLVGNELREFVDLCPPALLFFGSGCQVLRIRHRRGELIGKRTGWHQRILCC
jgi:hypothetical protein